MSACEACFRDDGEHVPRLHVLDRLLKLAEVTEERGAAATEAEVALRRGEKLIAKHAVTITELTSYAQHREMRERGGRRPAPQPPPPQPPPNVAPWPIYGFPSTTQTFGYGNGNGNFIRIVFS